MNLPKAPVDRRPIGGPIRCICIYPLWCHRRDAEGHPCQTGRQEKPSGGPCIFTSSRRLRRMTAKPIRHYLG